MAPKHPEIIENPPMASSTEEEEEESGSSGDETESSGDEGDDQSKSIQAKSVDVSAKKLEADSEDESDSDSDPKPAKKKQKSLNTVGSVKTKSSLPESSTGKRSLKRTEEEAKKKMKKSEEGAKKISGDDSKQQLFQRLFSETDEIALLQGILDFTTNRGDPQKDMDAFVEYVKKLINFNANRSQLVTKVQRLKKKFVNIVKNSLKKGKSEEEIVFSKDLDQKAFELSKKIWGNNGVLASKSKGNPKESRGNPKEFKLLPHHSPKKKKEETANVVNSGLSSGREVLSFFKTEKVAAFLDESKVTAGWDMVADGPKKREMEEKLKKLKALQVELCLLRTGLVADAAKLIFKDNASSSGM